MLQDSYWWQRGVVVGVLWVPASGRPPRVLIFWRQPAGIRDVCCPPSGMLSEQDESMTDTPLSQEQNNMKLYLRQHSLLLLHVLLCGHWLVVALSCDGSVALGQTAGVTAGSLQLSGAARHLQQILNVTFTQQLFGKIQQTQHLDHTNYNIRNFIFTMKTPSWHAHA